MKKIFDATDVRDCVSIRTVVAHIFESTKEVFNGTKFEDNWYVYHDEFSLMSSKATMNCMKGVGYYDRLVLPSF